MKVSSRVECVQKAPCGCSVGDKGETGRSSTTFILMTPLASLGIIVPICKMRKLKAQRSGMVV